MTCAELLRQLNRATSLAVALVLLRPVGAQQSTPPPLRLPSIALVQPQDGGTVPVDRPVLAFRFAAADPADQLDLGSLKIAVDSRDATPNFHVMPNEAWGKLDDAAVSTGSLAAGAHTVTARICSLRGVCGTITASFNVSTPASPGEAAPNAAKSTPGPRGLVGTLVKAAQDHRPVTRESASTAPRFASSRSHAAIYSASGANRANGHRS